MLETKKVTIRNVEVTMAKMPLVASREVFSHLLSCAPSNLPEGVQSLEAMAPSILRGEVNAGEALDMAIEGTGNFAYRWVREVLARKGSLAVIQESAETFCTFTYTQNGQRVTEGAAGAVDKVFGLDFGAYLEWLLHFTQFQYSEVLSLLGPLSKAVGPALQTVLAGPEKTP